MARAISVLVANSPGQVVEVPYRIHEPVYYVLQRIIHKLGLKQRHIFHHQLAINGITLADENKSMAEYRIFGSSVTYKYWARGPLSLTVKEHAGSPTSLSCQPTDTIHHLKEFLQCIKKIPWQRQRLFFNGYELEYDDYSMERHNIQHGCTIHLVCGLEGSEVSPPFNQVVLPGERSIDNAEPSEEKLRPDDLVYPGTTIEFECNCTPGHIVSCHRSFGLFEPTKASFSCPNCLQSNKNDLVSVKIYMCQCRLMVIGPSSKQHTTEWREVEFLQYVAKELKELLYFPRLMIQTRPSYELYECLICLGPRSGVVTFSCGHQFHQACYDAVKGCWSCFSNGQI